MNYRRITQAAYSWISWKKALWFLIFFWVSLPFLMMIPQAFDAGVYSSVTLPIAQALYSILYLTVLLGVIVLIQYCLLEKRARVSKITLSRLVDTVFLVFVEFFYLLVWNIKFPLRVIQLLLLIASALLYYYYLLVQTGLSYYLTGLVLLAYLVLVSYNAVRLFFSTTIFFSTDLGIKDSVKESWYLTHGKVKQVLYSLLLAIFVSFVLFWFLTIAFGAFASIVLKLFFTDFLSQNFFFIDAAAMYIGFKAAAAFALGPALIAYHYSITETFLQLNSGKESSHSVKRILAHKVLHKKEAPKRKLAKKKKR